MPIASRRSRRVTPFTTWGAVGVALIVHAVIAGTAQEIGISLVGQGFAAERKTAEETDLKSNCLFDSMLASSARYSLCFSPWRGDFDGCYQDAMQQALIDISTCNALAAAPFEDVEPIALVEPQVAEKVKPIDPERLLEELQQREKPPEPPKPLPKPEQQPPQQQQQPPPQAPSRPPQVVETVKPTQEKAPENSRFLAEYDSNVEKQTVARGTPHEAMIAKSKPAELAPKPDAKDPSVKEHPEDRPKGMNEKAPDVPGTLAMRTAGSQSPAEMQQDAMKRGDLSGSMGKLGLDGILPRHGQGAFDQERKDRSETPKGQNGAGGGVPDLPNLKPSQEVLERVIGGGNVDHLDDVDNGDETALSAKRWMYASFFNRLKRQVAQNWDPGSVWRRQDPTGQKYGLKTRVTEVRVSLDLRGDLSAIVVTNPSGVSELDDEAVRAFHAAAPFPNPPAELASKDHLITFAFSFFFEINASHTSWRVIRSM